MLPPPVLPGRPQQLPEYRTPVKPLTGNTISAQGGYAVFAGIIGVQGTVGPAVDTNGNICTVDTACVQFGLGGFAGPIVGGAYTLNGTLQEGATSETFGFFGEAAMFLSGIFGSIDFGLSSPDITLGAGPTLPGAVGAAGGVQFCRTTVHSCTK